MSRGGRLLWLAIAIAVLTLPACGGEEPAAKTEIDLGEILPPSLEVVGVRRLDSGVDPPSEWLWLVLYKYDISEHFSPIAGVVYRADRGGRNQPRVIYPYPLRLPDRDYLGTGKVWVESRDVLSVWDGLELVAKNQNADGFVTEVAIFVWHDSYPDDTWRKPEDGRSYECLGYFRSDGGVKVQQDVVVVKELENDRSQLARYYRYKPDEKGSYLVSGVGLRAVEDSWVDFAFRPIATDKVLDSPYPEKIVLAFYNALGTPNDIKPFLSKEARKQLDAEKLDYGCGWPLNQVKKVTVRQVSYFAAVEAQTEEEEERQSLVELKIRCESNLEGTASEDGDVGWFLKREGGQWKMDRAYKPTG